MNRFVVALLGIVIIVGNLGAVALLQAQPSAYKIEQVETWYAQAIADPSGAVASAWFFTIGLAAMVPFALAIVFDHDAPPSRLALTGAGSVAAGALLNAAGTLLPAVVVTYLAASPDVGHALLALTIDLDAAFNLLLGAGLLALSAAHARTWPRWLTGLGAIAGLASLPVAGQAFDDDFARLLVVSGPLWIAWILAVSIRSAKR